MNRLSSQFFRKIDNVEGFRRALLRADPAANAKLLINPDFGVRGLYNALIAPPVDRAHPDTKIIAAGNRVALLLFDNADTGHAFKNVLIVI